VQKLKAALRTRKNRYGDPISAKTADNILTVVAHALRHTYATHAARFGVSSWTLQSWLGHSSVTMTEKYVTLASRLGEAVPAFVTAAGKNQPDADRRTVAMLGARSEQRHLT